MTSNRFRAAERSIVRDPAGSFDPEEIADLPDDVQRYFMASVEPGTPVAQSVRVSMRGHIKVGRWLPYRAVEILNPRVGFRWGAVAAGVIRGFDQFVDGRGQMSWKLAAIIPVVRAEGPDVSRSAAERAAAEAVWVPTALLPRFGTEWSTAGDGWVAARYSIGKYPLELHLELSPEGWVRSVRFDRWGDPRGRGEYSSHSFGGEFDQHQSFGGLTIPTRGRLGWHYGTESWVDGEFFRFQITDLEIMKDESVFGSKGAQVR